MTQRRRFFVSHQAQYIPGPKVELSVRVRKDGTAKQNASIPTEVVPELSWESPLGQAGANWLRYPDPDPDPESPDIQIALVCYPDPDDTDLTVIEQDYYLPQPKITTKWRGTPWQRRASDDMPLPLHGSGWICTELQIEVSMSEALPSYLIPSYVGSVLGAPAMRVSWRLNWTDNASDTTQFNDPGLLDWCDTGDTAAVSRSGHIALAQGAQVRVYPIRYRGSDSVNDTLAAEAFVDGISIGILRFVAKRVGW